MRKKWVAVIVGIFLFAGVVIGAQQIMAKKSEQSLSKGEAIEEVETKYAGHVKKAVLRGDIYEMKLENAYGTYNVELDKDTGNILRLTLVKKSTGSKEKKKQAPRQELPQPKVSEREAEQIALHRMKGNGKIKKIKLDTEKGKPVYTVEGETADTKTELTIDGNTGDVSFYSTEQKDKEDHTRPKQKTSPTITFEKAKQIALSKVKGSIDEIKKEKSDGSYVYKVDIDTKDEDATVVIQAYTGKVLSVTREENENDDDDDGETR